MFSLNIYFTIITFNKNFQFDTSLLLLPISSVFKLFKLELLIQKLVFTVSFKLKPEILSFATMYFTYSWLKRYKTY